MLNTQMYGELVRKRESLVIESQRVLAKIDLIDELLSAGKAPAAETKTKNPRAKQTPKPKTKARKGRVAKRPKKTLDKKNRPNSIKDLLITIANANSGVVKIADTAAALVKEGFYKDEAEAKRNLSSAFGYHSDLFERAEKGTYRLVKAA